MADSGASRAKSAALNRREWPRYTAEETFALAASVGGKILPCTVADVSLGGARLVFDEDLLEGTGGDVEMIELSHPDSEPVLCAPVWHSKREIGVGFDFSEDSLGLISICIRNMIDLEHQPRVLAG